jgi:ubiquinone/menaquinone biosynthesis C-methylase UbiE
MDYKEATRKAYDASAAEYEANTKDYLRHYIFEDAKLFLANLPGKRILDLGSGPGRDAYFFKGMRFEPVCLDNSPEMVKLCQAKGLDAKVGDLEKPPFEPDSFDGVWAYTSLLHVPKNMIHNVLLKVKRIMIKEGLIYVGMKEVEGECFKQSRTNPGIEKFFALYSDEEFTDILSRHFKLLHTSKVSLSGSTYLNYLAKK